MHNYTLSYIISTRNRLPFLKITLGKLLEAVHSNEEIVVVDGNSTDGTQAYLKALLDTGKIHQYVSEADKNQAHGWNKAMLMAKGMVLKKIMDDDIFDYISIRKCADYMLNNPAIDVVISNDLGCSLYTPSTVTKNTRLPQFESWAKGTVPSFTFSDVNMLIRRSALSYIGLYHTSFVMMDYEYALRISYFQANISYYTGYNSLSVWHGQTISALKDLHTIKGQGKRANTFYEYAGDGSEINIWSKIKICIGKIVFSTKKADTPQLSTEDIKGIYDLLYKHILEINKDSIGQFIDSTTTEL